MGFIEEITHSSESIPTGQASHLAATASLDQSGRGSPVPPSNAKSWKATDKKMAGQFQYKSKVEDNTTAQQLYDRALASSISVMPGELLAISPDIRRLFVDSCRVNRIPVYSATGEVSSELPTTSVLMATPVPMYTVPIMELDVQLSGKHPEVALYDTGAELVCISTVAANELRLPFNPDLKIRMRDANGGTKTTFGVVENLEIGINGIAVIVHAWIIDNPPYRLLLGRPFQIAAQVDTEETGGVLVIKDPANPEHRLRVPMRPLSVRYKERYLKACAQRSLCRRYVTQSFEAQLLCNCDERSMT